MRTCTSSSLCLVLLLAIAGSNAFAPQQFPNTVRHSKTSLNILDDPDPTKMARAGAKYKPGGADTEFARRYRHLVGAKIRTVAEAFAEFTKEFGYTINPLYKNMMTDLVGTTHLITVNARFKRDELWCLGTMTTLELLLKNYPEPDVKKKIIAALFKSVGMDVGEVQSQAEVMRQWVQGQTKEDVEAALQGQGDSPLAKIAKNIKADEFWMYSRFFGIGLVKLMEIVGIEMDKDEVYPVMEDWMSNKLGRSHLTAGADSDLFFRVKDKLDMMETMMKEIEIREKKRMAERLEAKAEAALAAAEKEKKMQDEIAAEKAKETVDA
ncbi:hypothetical protein ACA910_014662 [Epithemia clementina (nom. ined.)]